MFFVRYIVSGDAFTVLVHELNVADPFRLLLLL